MYDSTTPPDPQTNPTGFYQQRQQAQQMLKQAQQPGQGGMGYARQIASALAGGYKMSQLRDAARASDILNGGTGAGGAMGGLGGVRDFASSPAGQMWGKFTGMFGGG